MNKAQPTSKVYFTKAISQEKLCEIYNKLEIKYTRSVDRFSIIKHFNYFRTQCAFVADHYEEPGAGHAGLAAQSGE